MAQIATTSAVSVDVHGKSGRELANYGINLMLNNNHADAEKIFRKYKDTCVQMRMGYCFMAFMNALMTFEEEKINSAIQILKETETKFAHEISSFQSMRRMMFGHNERYERNLEKRLEEQISVADCQVCMAILTFTHQDFTNYVKGGWILRKAWKIYDRTYREIKELYEKMFGTLAVSSLSTVSRNQSADDLTNPTNWISTSDESLGEQLLANGEPVQLGSIPAIPAPARATANAPAVSDLSAEVVARLLASVSFGYGTFQLCISLFPANLLRIIHFLGFDGDQEIGLESLMYARSGDDIRAPFATLGLLWYHTIVRPFFSLDGHNVAAGVDAAQRLLDESKNEYGSAALFLFYKGRIERLQGRTEQAINAYETALTASKQREIQLICIHEMGWCYILQLNWSDACQSFIRLKEDSRWAKSFYTYLVAICLGIMDKSTESHQTMFEVPSLIRKKNNQLEAFVLKRSQRLVKENPSKFEMFLYGLELIYIWHTLPSCTLVTHDNMLTGCDAITTKKLLPLKCLIEGAIHNQKGNREIAIQYFEESIARSSDIKEDVHIPAFATYELSMILLQNPHTFDRGKTLLYHVKDDFKGYDFENRLSVRIHAAMKNLERPPPPPPSNP